MTRSTLADGQTCSSDCASKVCSPGHELVMGSPAPCPWDSCSVPCLCMAKPMSIGFRKMWKARNDRRGPPSAVNPVGKPPR